MRPILRRFAPLLIALPIFAVAQDEVPGSAALPPEEPAAPLAIDTPPAEPTVAAGTVLAWRLLGGGQILGAMVKQTPKSVFVDIGPTVIEIPLDSIVDRVDPSKAAENPAVGAAPGQGSGVFDPETGSVIFTAEGSAAGLQSQREIIESVKKSVVLVSNPGGLGTGWLVSADGRLVTNHHVVGRERFQTVTIFVKKGEQWEKKKIDNCKVEAFSDLLDIAVVQLDMEKVRELGIELRPLVIAPPGSLEAGDAVVAIGNPGMGGMVLDHTVSEGIVSSLARNFNDVIYLQTTAAVNPGNSGGPLVNSRGEVVGLITLKAIFQEGVAFALPVDQIHTFLKYSEAYAVSEFNRNQGYRYHSPE